MNTELHLGYCMEMTDKLYFLSLTSLDGVEDIIGTWFQQYGGILHTSHVGLSLLAEDL